MSWRMSRSLSRLLLPLFKPRRELCSQAPQSVEENPFMKKYADKITALQNSSPEDYKCQIEKLSSKNTETIGKKESTPKKDVANPTISYTNKGLDAVMKLDLLQDKSSSEIETIWNDYHKGKDGLFAVVPSDVYKKIHLKLLKYPMFLYALPRDQGYEFILSHFSVNSCYFTPLLKYQAYKENAPPCLTLTYFSELQESKGIVLMRGEYDSDNLKAHEAQCLTNQLQMYYGGSDEKKERLLWNFNKEPDTFRHIDLIAELEFGLKCI